MNTLRIRSAFKQLVGIEVIVKADKELVEHTNQLTCVCFDILAEAGWPRLCVTEVRGARRLGPVVMSPIHTRRSATTTETVLIGKDGWPYYRKLAHVGFDSTHFWQSLPPRRVIPARESERFLREIINPAQRAFLRAS